MFGYQRKPGYGGKGALVYTPIRYEDGKMILPPDAQPTKTDWPTKKAAHRKMFSPIEVPDDEEFIISTSSNN